MKEKENKTKTTFIKPKTPLTKILSKQLFLSIYYFYCFTTFNKNIPSKSWYKDCFPLQQEVLCIGYEDKHHVATANWAEGSHVTAAPTSLLFKTQGSHADFFLLECCYSKIAKKLFCMKHKANQEGIERERQLGVLKLSSQQYSTQVSRMIIVWMTDYAETWGSRLLSGIPTRRNYASSS